MKKIILAPLFFLIGCAGFAQTQFISKAKIEFEKKINVWINLKGEFGDQMKKNIPEYQVSYFDYQFDNNKSIYKPGKEVAGARNGFFGMMPASGSIIYTDYQSGNSIAKKEVFEKTYVIDDSLKNAQWKITNDFREIAGFNCRRATTILFDSVFVVAFYTDEIMISGGPQSFHGLPGMILGLVVNRLHTTWYATKVELNSVKDEEIVPPSTGKAEKITTEKLLETLKKLPGWAQNDQIVWSILL